MKRKLQIKYPRIDGVDYVEVYDGNELVGRMSRPLAKLVAEDLARRAGVRTGRKLAKQRGPEYYSRIGRKGAEAKAAKAKEALK